MITTVECDNVIYNVEDMHFTIKNNKHVCTVTLQGNVLFSRHTVEGTGFSLSAAYLNMLDNIVNKIKIWK